eukprot:752385-Amphidinium_carterae.1
MKCPLLWVGQVRCSAHAHTLVLFHNHVAPLNVPEGRRAKGLGEKDAGEHDCTPDQHLLANLSCLT